MVQFVTAQSEERKDSQQKSKECTRILFYNTWYISKTLKLTKIFLINKFYQNTNDKILLEILEFSTPILEVSFYKK